MAIPKITEIIGLGQFLTAYRWNVSMSGPGATAAGFTSAKSMNFRCESTTLPQLSGSSAEITIRGHKVKQPGIYNYNGQITLVLVETTDVVVHTAMKKWRDLCWKAETGVQSDKSKVVATVKLEQLDNNDKVVWSYELHQAYYEDGDFGQLDNTNQDAQKPSLVLSYDYFKDGPGTTVS